MRITKRQHYVSQFYLRQWNDANGQITCHDLIDGKTFTCDPCNALAQTYLYEEDKAAPDNRVERILAGMEGTCSVTFQKIHAASLSAIKETDKRKAAAMVQGAFTSGDLDNLGQFAAYQYMRVPGAISQKALELQPSGVPAEAQAHALNPGRFVESGYDYVKDRFQKMKVALFVSPGREFITSDWPCFDMKDSASSPLLGEEIGRDARVLCYLPLTPLLGAVFYPGAFVQGATRMPRLHMLAATDMMVRNQNTLVIQQAERFVVASRGEPFIFKVASKRKKARSGQASGHSR